MICALTGGWGLRRPSRLPGNQRRRSSFLSRYRGKFSHLFFMEWLELRCADRKEQNSKCFNRLGQPPGCPYKEWASRWLSKFYGRMGDGEPLFDRRAYSNHRRARSRWPLTGCLDGKSIVSLISCPRFVFVIGHVDFFQLAAYRLLRNVRAAHRAAYPDWKQATSTGCEINVGGRVLAPIRQCD